MALTVGNTAKRSLLPCIRADFVLSFSQLCIYFSIHFFLCSVFIPIDLTKNSLGEGRGYLVYTSRSQCLTEGSPAGTQAEEMFYDSLQIYSKISLGVNSCVNVTASMG